MEHKYTPKELELFHVHTYRCGHAGIARDEQYVDTAIELGASRIVFTDHTPFPGNPFPNRMNYEQLPEYIASISSLKEQYKNKIEIMCGLEVEYLPSYCDYYLQLRQIPGIDLLIVGQHFFEHEPGVYSIKDTDKTYEFEGQCHAMAQAISSGIFDVIAHPDRSFRASAKLGERELAAVKELIQALAACSPDSRPFMEHNISSMQSRNFYKKEFWELMPDYVNTTIGIDAHHPDDLVYAWEHYIKARAGINNGAT